MYTDPVQAQLDAYNARDIDAFLSCYARDAVIRHADGRVLLQGHTDIRRRYQLMFDQNPELTAQVPTRIRAGRWVVDEEKVHLSEGELHVVVGYEVHEGLIHSVVMMRSDL
ncbi:MAG: nuclear transport factor 2 family protein [Jatrophihabitans sp.]|uniref:nuclear transport factor 2 family protein n=1 Tax=Jatrophihabitans sp. TaxID=1932789 RepID=UPI003911DC8B